VLLYKQEDLSQRTVFLRKLLNGIDFLLGNKGFHSSKASQQGGV